MKDIIKIGILFAIMVKVILMIMVGTIPLPDFVSNVINNKKMTDGDTIQIQGMGHFNYSTLLQVKQIVEETYGQPTKIVQPIVLTSAYYTNGGIDSDKCLSDFDDNQNKIIVTNERCYSNDDNVFVGGQAEMFGNIVIIGENKSNTIKRVLIHEIGHNQGLTHCDNPNCLMSEHRDNDDNNLSLCDDCKNN
jgi:hypothetical protein